jgi:hypothetical protein
MHDSLSEAEIFSSLGLDDIKNRQWALHKVSAINGVGLNEAFEWYVHY